MISMRELFWLITNIKRCSRRREKSMATRGAAAVVDPGGHRRRGHVEAALKLAHLIEDADLAVAAVAHVDGAVVGHGHAVHRLVAFRNPLAHELATGVEYGDLRVAGVVLTVGDVDIAIAAIDKNARRHVEGGMG